MDRNELIQHWTNAATSGSLLTPKHDPGDLSFAWSKYRSVLTPAMSASLESFVQSGDYTINEYSDANYPHAAGLFEVIPNPGSGFTVVGSGVNSGSITPSGPLDRLILVSGSTQGWHVYAESATAISQSVSSGRLNLLQSLGS